MAKRKVGPSDSSSEEDAVMPDSGPTRQYCSQACLLGLKKSWGLDDSCPNALSHRVAGGVDTRHPINADEFTCLVGKRLCEDPYRDCRALDGWGKKGAIGVLFRLELAPYGYTFVGKGFSSRESAARVSSTTATSAMPTCSGMPSTAVSCLLISTAPSFEQPLTLSALCSIWDEEETWSG